MDLDPIVQSAIVGAIAAITTAWIANRRKDPVREVQTEHRVRSTRRSLQRAESYMEQIESENERIPFLEAEILRLRRQLGLPNQEDI